MKLHACWVHKRTRTSLADNLIVLRDGSEGVKGVYCGLLKMTVERLKKKTLLPQFDGRSDFICVSIRHHLPLECDGRRTDH